MNFDILNITTAFSSVKKDSGRGIPKWECRVAKMECRVAYAALNFPVLIKQKQFVFQQFFRSVKDNEKKTLKISHIFLRSHVCNFCHKSSKKIEPVRK